MLNFAEWFSTSIGMAMWGLLFYLQEILIDFSDVTVKTEQCIEIKSNPFGEKYKSAHFLWKKKSLVFFLKVRL